MSYEQKTYAERLAALNADQSIFERDKVALRKQLAEQEYGAPSFDINEFEGLLSRLESSKKRQQRQKSVEGRRDIFATGLAGMMGNF